MGSYALKLLILLAMLLGLPLLGVYVAGLPVSLYFQFPPKTSYVMHAPFSWTAFIAYAVVIAAVLIFFIFHLLKTKEGISRGDSQPVRAFPWWGWLGIAAWVTSWILAWTRFTWFADWQLYTFTPLWLFFIVVINGLTYRRKGECLLINQTKFFLLLFPTSAAFWWFFEYLNRFVQNWYYTSPDYDALQYFLLATLPFCTVLPAVLSVREWFLTHPSIKIAFEDSIAIRPGHPKMLAWTVLIIAAFGLAFIGVFPNDLFPLLWISPGLIIVSLQTLQGERHILSDISHGDWTLAAASALSALFCGCFWEMWNYYSLAKWQYAIPFVNRFHLFEMPILGYAGYLPFGLECAAIGGLVSAWLYSNGR